jgi:hypothetical protein
MEELMIKMTNILQFILLFFLNVAYADNTLSITSQATTTHLTIELNLTNSDTLSGIQIPLDLGLSKLGLQFDSVSFAGSRVEHFYGSFYNIYPEQNKVFIFILESADAEINSAPLLPGSGKIATIYLTRVSTPESDSHEITNERIEAPRRDLSFSAWDYHGKGVTLEFVPLGLKVQKQLD